MQNRPLHIAVMNYDRVQALTSGSLGIEGVAPTYHHARIVPEIFEGMIRRRAYDVAEMGMTYLLRVLEAEDRPFLALPVFPNRFFRHSAIFINKHAGIRSPQDLNGKVIGELALYGHDAGVVPKGILAEEFGFRPETCRWVIGGIDFPMAPIDFVPQPHPANVEVTRTPAGTDLGKMLERGEIDALISADVPHSVLQGGPNVGRLFEDYVAVEQAYFRRTGIFPIMHTVVVPRALAEQEPTVVQAVYRAFCQAKEAAADQLLKGMTFNNYTSMLPWISALLQQDRALLGEDWWPYGIRRNTAALDAILRYHWEQGITKRRFRVEDIFVPCLLDS